MTPFFSWQHAVRASKLEPTTKLVCYTIGLRMAADGTGCFPSYSTIADESGLSRSTVIEHVSRAERAGYLVKESRDRPNGSASSNIYRPCMPEGGPGNGLGVIRQADQGSQGDGPGVVRELDPHNNPSEQTKESLPPTPSGGGVWEDDPSFMEVCRAYAALNADRVDTRKAWEAWTTGKLETDAETILKALPHYASGEQWWKEGGRFIPSLSKWLSDRGWKNVAAGLPTADQLRERERIGKAEQDAYAKVQNDMRMGRESTGDEIAAANRYFERIRSAKLREPSKSY